MKEITCPHCQQPIYDDDALSCHFCGESLNRSSSGALGLFKKPGMKIAVAIVTVIVLLIFLFTY